MAYDDITEEQSQLLSTLVEALKTGTYETEFSALSTLAGLKITLRDKSDKSDKEIDNFSHTDLIALSEGGYITLIKPNQYSYRASLKLKAFEQYQLHNHPQKTSLMACLFSTTFWLVSAGIYFSIVAGIWGFVEAYTYFQGDSLKKLFGPYWITLYLLPLPIALVVGRGRFIIAQRLSRRNTVEVAAKSSPKRLDKKLKTFLYKGLLWKPARFKFQYPIPICPYDDCGRPVYCERESPPKYLVSADMQAMQDFLNKQGTYRYIYKCPIHGELTNVPDTHIDILIREAKFEQNR